MVRLVIKKVYCVALLKVPTLICDFAFRNISIIPLFFWFWLEKIDME